MFFEPKTRSENNNRILIIGGYGQVGQIVAAQLAPLFPSSVVVAGPNLEKANAAASEIGYGAEAQAINLFATYSKDALLDIALVIVCLDQTDTRFVEQCLMHGIHYVDISANYDFLSQIDRLDDLALTNNATVILSVGVAPGLTNMLARRVSEQMERIDQIDIILEFGLGDHHGQAAVEWMFDNLDVAYTVQENGQPISVRSFSESIDIGLPGQDIERPAYRFNFSDQHVIGHTLNVPTVSTWVRFDDPISTWLIAKLSQAGFGGLLKQSWGRAVAIWLLMNTHIGTNICGVAVQAKGKAKDGANTLTLGIIGQREALMTAVITAEIARQTLFAPPPPGVHHSEQVIDLDPVIASLRRELPDLVVAL